MAEFGVAMDEVLAAIAAIRETATTPTTSSTVAG